MRILRVPTDFRVVEQFDEAMLTRRGDYLVYSVSTKGMTTAEAADRLAQAAGVDSEAVVSAAQKPKEGVAGQVFSIYQGQPLSMRGTEFVARRLGVSDRPVEAGDITGNAYEIVVRDLRGDDMRRLRHNLAQVKQGGLPNYFDDQRFGCLRHGQGYIVREVLRGRYEEALKSALAAPSPYGAEALERYKRQIRENWGSWTKLVALSNGRRGKSAFEHLAANEGDFLGALRFGLSSRERAMHLYAYQSHLFNRALAAKVCGMVEGESLAWLPCDEGSLPVWRELSAFEVARLEAATLTLPGPGMDQDEEAMRLYRQVFESEGITVEQFCGLDLPGFRPIAEPRPLLMQPEYLRAAPAQDDEFYPRSRKMRVRFTLPRGQYPALALKRLLMPTESGAKRLCMWVSRHPLVWPMDDGTPQVFERRPQEERLSYRRKVEQGPRERGGDNWGRSRRDDRKPGGRPAGQSGGRGPRPSRDEPRDKPGWGRNRRDDRYDGRGSRGPSNSPWGDRE
ncbi:MAG: tRNA pseudouridine(13) synthase TruD [Planctomycetes bacterium]|nr:tRNA pseudouridine(13) synthase TruD [Planctomycetota bacterium]